MADAPKTILITGAARRIGSRISRAFAREGYRLALHANRSAEDAEALAVELREAFGVETVVLQADLGKEGPASGLVPAAVDAFGRLDVVVNNASNFLYDDVTNFTWEQATKSMTVNCWSPVSIACAFGAHVKERSGQGPGQGQGVLINLLDIKVNNPDARFLSYELSKCALAAATPGLARALAPQVRVNGVAPGLTMNSGQKSAEDFDSLHSQNLLGEGPQPEDIAEAVLFLVKAEKITGQTICVASGANLLGVNQNFYASLTEEVLAGKG